MIIAGSADIYYPQGNDWGNNRRLNFVMADAVTTLFSKVAQLRHKAARLEEKHTEYVLHMQARFRDGRTYDAPSEDRFSGREEWIAEYGSRAYLIHWLAEKQVITFTNKKY